jgi:hypothetical protein
LPLVLSFGGNLAAQRFGTFATQSSALRLKSDITPCPESADSVAKVFLSHRPQIFWAVGAAIEY